MRTRQKQQSRFIMFSPKRVGKKKKIERDEDNVSENSGVIGPHRMTLALLPNDLDKSSPLPAPLLRKQELIHSSLSLTHPRKGERILSLTQLLMYLLDIWSILLPFLATLISRADVTFWAAICRRESWEGSKCMQTTHHRQIIMRTDHLNPSQEWKSLPPENKYFSIFPHVSSWIFLNKEAPRESRFYSQSVSQSVTAPPGN